MANRESQANWDEKRAEGYRGAFVYSQEDGYKLIAMQVHLFEGEHSHVMSHVYNFPFVEEAQHLPAQPPFAGIDLYRFPATDGTNIMLTVEGPETKHTAVYSVRETAIDEHAVFLRLGIVEWNGESKEFSLQLPASHDRQAAFDEALDYYKDQIPVWLDMQDQRDMTTHEPLPGYDIDFGR